MATYNSGVITIPVQLNPVELARLNVPLLGALEKWQTPDEQLKWNVNVGGSTATGEAVTADISDFDGDTVKPAALSIATYRLRSSFTVNEVKYTQAAARGQDALANLIETSMMGARREILQTLGRRIITGTGNEASGGVIGLNAIVASSTGTANKETSTVSYAGIDPATDALWTNLVWTSFGTLTKKKMHEFEADLLQGTTSGVPANYNAIAMSPTTAVKYAEVFDTSTQMAVAPLAGVDLGVGTMTYNGRPIIADPSVTDGEMHFVDSTQIRLYSFNQAEGAGMSDEEPMDGLLMYAKQLPSNNPQALKFSLFGMYQLQERDRSAHSVIKGITV